MSERKQMQNEEVTIDLLELFSVWMKKLPLIILSLVFFAGVAFAGTKFLITPKYTAETKMYVLSKQDENSNVTYSDVQLSSQLVKDYMELVTSSPVLDETISKLNLDMEDDELASMISTENSSDTRIISIKVTDTDPERAKNIANEVRDAVGDQIVKVMDADAVNTVEEAKTPTEPSSPSTAKNTALGGLIGLVLALGLITLSYLRDDTIKDKEDVEQYLGLNVLTAIPLAEGVAKGKKSKKKSGKGKR
jgi:capsular polysaccharide biosynthesis protein